MSVLKLSATSDGSECVKQRIGLAAFRGRVCLKFENIAAITS